MRDNSNLRRLLREVPILHIDEKAALARSDHDAVRYAQAIREWQAAAARELAQGVELDIERRDPFERIEVASRLLQSSAQEPA